jgi:predicted DsbA family dithiol-disulfide isomerase
MPALRVEIWSDVVCPWCYIGKRRVEKAIAASGADDVEVVWRSFRLDPSAPAHDPGASPVRVVDHLAQAYGTTPEQAAAMMSRVDAIAADDGLVYDQSQSVWAGTLDAHRLLHAAREHGGPALQGALKETFLRGYFSEHENLGDPRTLVRLAAAAGLPGEVAHDVLVSDAHRDAVVADEAQARAYGANGVPFVVVDGRFGVSGAQPVEVFADVLARARG